MRRPAPPNMRLEVTLPQVAGISLVRLQAELIQICLSLLFNDFKVFKLNEGGLLFVFHAL